MAGLGTHNLDCLLDAIDLVHVDALARGLGKEPKLRGGRGEIDCPMLCGGRLRYVVVGINGHLHGSCTSEGCLQWME